MIGIKSIYTQLLKWVAGNKTPFDEENKYLNTTTIYDIIQAFM